MQRVHNLGDICSSSYWCNWLKYVRPTYGIAAMGSDVSGIKRSNSLHVADTKLHKFYALRQTLYNTLKGHSKDY